MALGDSYRDDLLTAIADRAATPAAPSVPKFSAWSAIPRGIGEAGAQVGATLSDAAASFRYMRDATPEQRKQIDRQGVPIEQFSSAAGDELRDLGKTLRPDPITASAAESVLYGFARGAAKVVAGAVVGGVPGVLAAGLEESITQSDELRRQGVDLQTRSNVGLVQGAGLALAALPAAGATLKSTAALYLAGGPGGFVAQQALTREILRNAGQDKLAEQYDPFDPVGLAVSALIPAPFAFYGLRASKRAAAAKAAEDFRAGPVPSEQTPVAGAVREAYAPETVDAAMVAHMGERQQHADSVASTIGRPVESLATFVQREGFKEPPRAPAPGPDTFLAWIKANGGLAIGEKFDITGEQNAIRSNPAGIFRRGGASSDDLASRAASEGYTRPDQEGDTRGFVEMVQRAINGDRVLTFEQQMDKAARDHADTANSARLADLEQRLRLLGEDPAGARGNPDAIAAYLDRNEPRLLSAAMDEMMAAQRAADGLPEFDHLRDRARLVLQDMQDGGRTLAQYETDFGALSPVMRRAVESAQKETSAPTATNPPETSARPTTANKAGEIFIDTRGAGVRLHGTGNPIAALSNEYAMNGDSRNIYGQGFYTTDAADIAAGYMKKGGKSSVLYHVEVRDGAKLYDMEQPMSAEVAQIARDTMGDDFPTENRDTGKPLKTLREVYDEYRAESRENGLSRDDVQEAFDSIRFRLEADGYTGFQHIGGAATGNRAHAVQIFWMPERDVSITPITLDEFKPDATATPQAPSPETAAPARGAGDAPAPAAVPEPGRAGADVQASGLTPGAKAEAVAAQARMADVQAAHPDLQVMLDGMDKPMPLADFLAAVKAEADEMEADAPLMQVAAQCAILNGS